MILHLQNSLGLTFVIQVTQHTAGISLFLSIGGTHSQTLPTEAGLFHAPRAAILPHVPTETTLATVAPGTGLTPLTPHPPAPAP